MNLYLITRTDNWSYDNYDSAIVCAPDEEAARRTHPSNTGTYDRVWSDEYNDWFYTANNGEHRCDDGWGSWAKNINKVDVNFIGVANADVVQGVVLASFNAG